MIISIKWAKEYDKRKHRELSFSPREVLTAYQLKFAA